MRCMDKYSVIHQCRDHSSILRLAWNPINAQTIGYIMENKQTVSVIDIRSPEQELFLRSHTAPVNAIDWSPSQESVLITAGEDSKVRGLDVKLESFIVLDMGFPAVEEGG